ncbi:DNA-binding protein RFX6-like [Folsomia candida]|uniref:DNA-binding protein RFX6-like n=1 Tax=Folsomia candida TaxID=158441 RepID=UPI00160542D7|nr:DNA-binding protein RFX6-like [Folsomia candida]
MGRKRGHRQKPRGPSSIRSQDDSFSKLDECSDIEEKTSNLSLCDSPILTQAFRTTRSSTSKNAGLSMGLEDSGMGSSPSRKRSKASDLSPSVGPSESVTSNKNGDTTLLSPIVASENERVRTNRPSPPRPNHDAKPNSQENKIKMHHNPIQTSTPIKSVVPYQTYSFFSLITGDEEESAVVNTTPQPGNNDLNTPVRMQRTPARRMNKSIDGIFPNLCQKTPEPRRRNSPNESRADGDTSNVILVPLYHKFDLDAGFDDQPGGSGRYGLRPRNLFNSGVSIKKYDMFGENDTSVEDEKADKDDEDVFFFLQSDDDEDDYFEMDDIMEGQEKKRSSYSGIRGPKADAKALSLVTNCPVSVKWLVDNFEYCPGRSLPRGFVYDQYVLLCNQNALEPVNAASFGKLIRSVFPGLKTRRLGTRGNSKYHYNGVYLKTNSHLMVILNLVKTQQGLSYDGNGKRGRRVRRCFEGIPSRSDIFKTKEHPDEFADCSPLDYLGKRRDTGPFVQLQVDHSVTLSFDSGLLNVFESMYHSHCQMILTHVEKFDLRLIYNEWKLFWRNKPHSTHEEVGAVHYKSLMSKSTLFKICSLESVQQYIMSMDLFTYQYAIDILYPCLSKGMPISMVNTLRSFIKEGLYLFNKILEDYPKLMVSIKTRCFQTLLVMLDDYSNLNRMLKSAVSTIRNVDNIQAMHSELCRSINFENMEKQVALFKKQSALLVQNNLILEFRQNLDQHQNYSIKCWVHWGEMVAQRLVEESNRQVAEGEVTKQMECPFSIWKNASDRMLGAIVKDNAVSFGVFKGFLQWCDNIIQHITKLTIARSEGYTLPIFYYETILRERDQTWRENTKIYKSMTLAQQQNRDQPGGSRNVHAGAEEILGPAHHFILNDNSNSNDPLSNYNPPISPDYRKPTVTYFNPMSLTNGQTMSFATNAPGPSTSSSDHTVPDNVYHN